MQGCGRDDAVGHVRDVSTRHAGEGLHNRECEIVQQEPCGVVPDRIVQLCLQLCGNTSLLVQVLNFHEAYCQYENDKLTPVGRIEDFTGLRSEMRAVLQVPDLSMRVGHDIRHHMSTLGKSLQISRRPSSIFSSVIPSPLQSPRKDRRGVGRMDLSSCSI